MICSKCGAEVPEGKIYCNVCGKEVQLIPDYNFLEEDMLSDILSKGIRGIRKKRSTLAEESWRAKWAKYKYVFIWAAVVLLMMGAAVVLLRIRDMRRENSYDYQLQQAVKYQEVDNLRESLHYFLRAWELAPEDENLPYEIADIYLELDEAKLAETVIKQAAKAHGYDENSCGKLIEIYDSMGEYDKIRELCEEVKNSDLLELFDDYLVERPSFTKISGTYTSEEKIRIISSKGYEIYYTTDGSDPAESGKLYQGELKLKNGTTLVQAVTKSPKGIYSEVVKATYTIQYKK